MTDATRVLWSNQGGHAPGHIRNAFVALVEGADWWCYFDEWETLDEAPVGAWERLLLRLWECTDIMPRPDAEGIGLIHGSTYADGAHKVTADELLLDDSPNYETLEEYWYADRNEWTPFDDDPDLTFGEYLAELAERPDRIRVLASLRAQLEGRAKGL